MHPLIESHRDELLAIAHRRGATSQKPACIPRRAIALLADAVLL